METSILLEEAVEQLEHFARELEAETVDLQTACGRIAAADLFAPRPQPPFDRSPLDGYAVRARDVEGAGAQSPVPLRVVDKLYAGDCAEKQVCAGAAVRLMTGCMIPPGADCVIRQEDTDGGEETVRIMAAVERHANICFCGEEYGTGERLIARGTRLDPAAVCVLAGAGFDRVPVCRKIRVGILITGDEVASPGTPLPAGKIYDANHAYLAARLRELGAEVVFSEYVRDDLNALCARLSKERCAGLDLLITTGGVSVGQRDLIPAAVEQSGARTVFHGVRIKPGMPTLFALQEQTLLLGLSGNPFSAAVAFELLIHPLFAAMTRSPRLQMRCAQAVAEGAFEKSSPVRRLLRARCLDGRVMIPTGQANGQMRSMIGCNCLVDLPAGTRRVEPGQTVRVLFL